MKPGEWYDEDYFSGNGRKNSLSGPYTWDRLGRYFVGTAAHIRKWYQPARVADFGCATGHLVRALRDAGCDAFGLDHSLYALAAADERVKPYLHAQDLIQPLTAGVQRLGPVDLVTCFDLMEHINEDDVDHVLDNIRMLDPKYVLLNICVDEKAGFDYSHMQIRPRGYWHKRLMHNLGQHGYMPDDRVLDSNVWWFNDEDSAFVYRRMT